MTPQRIQRRRTKGWRMPAGAVNVCRPSDWGNPFRVGDIAMPHVVTVTPALACALFEAWVIEHGWLTQIQGELEGRDLVCWCPLDQPCHADVLLRIANP